MDRKWGRKGQKMDRKQRQKRVENRQKMGRKWVEKQGQKRVENRGRKGRKWIENRVEKVERVEIR